MSLIKCLGNFPASETGEGFKRLKNVILPHDRTSLIEAAKTVGDVEAVKQAIDTLDKDLIRVMDSVVTAHSEKHKKDTALAAKYGIVAQKAVEGEKKQETPRPKGRLVIGKGAPSTELADAEKAWASNVIAVVGASAPTWEQLSTSEQRTFADYNSNNWNLHDAQELLKKTRPAVFAEKKPAKRSQGKLFTGMSVVDVATIIKDFIRGNIDKHVVVVSNVAAIPANVLNDVETESGVVDERTQGFVHGGKVWIIASNLSKDTVRSVFMHEAGVHFGIESLLSKAEMKVFADKIRAWASETGNASVFAKNAVARVKDADTKADQTDSELVAYFVEEAVQGGVDPSKTSYTAMGRLLNNLWIKTARLLQRWGIYSFTPRDLVSFAYGAARIQMGQEVDPNTGVIARSYAGIKALGFTAEGKADFVAAKLLHANKANAAKIFRDTGWYLQGDDKKWRFEISDDKASLNPLFMERMKGMVRGGVLSPNAFRFINMNLSSMLRHPALYNAYPWLRQYKVRFDPTLADGAAWLDANTKEIVLATESFRDNLDDESGMFSTVLHEVQHAIQQYEGFGGGGDSEQVNILAPEQLKRLITAIRHRRDTFSLDRLHLGDWSKEQVARLIGQLERLSAMSSDNAAFLESLEDEYVNHVETRNTFEAQHPGPQKAWTAQQKMNAEHIEREIERAAEALSMAFDAVLVEENIDASIVKLRSLQYMAYLNLIGEIEANDTSDRRHMTADQRRMLFPEGMTAKGVSFNKFDPSRNSISETLRSKPGADVQRTATLLGQALYSGMEDMPLVAVKELMQNSFDAVVPTVEQGGRGRIAIYTENANSADPGGRAAAGTIRIVDNGTGMSPKIMANQFLQIAGTYKERTNSSGGLGIAKLQFLYGDRSDTHKIKVISVRNGVVSTLETTGKQLFEAMADPEIAPDIKVQKLEELSTKEYEKVLDALAQTFMAMTLNFNKNTDIHGTSVSITVPRQYFDPKEGVQKDIKFYTVSGSIPPESISKSPLFHNIDVIWNGKDVAGVGSKFKATDFAPVVNVSFPWGKAKLFVSTAKTENTSSGRNLSVLSNGLFQFSKSIKVNPLDIFGKNVDREFFLDVQSDVKPEEQGYPFSLNRMNFNHQTEEDFKKIFSYISLLYRGEELEAGVKTFGTLSYYAQGSIKPTKEEEIRPDIPLSSGLEPLIREGDKITVDSNGNILVNGNPMRELTRKDLEEASINPDKLIIPQDSLEADKVALHDNMVKVKDTQESRDLQAKVAEQKRKTYDYTKREQTRKALLEFTVKQGNHTTFSADMRAKYADRFDIFMHEIGSVFLGLRTLVVGAVPGYAELNKLVAGVSFDAEYRGVHTYIPFKSMFVNPAAVESLKDHRHAAYAMLGTMIHEIAHFQEHGHDHRFPAEMQKIMYHLEAGHQAQYRALAMRLASTVENHFDIMEHMNKEMQDGHYSPRGERFTADTQQRPSGNVSSDAANLREAGQTGPGIRRSVRSRSASNAQGGDQSRSPAGDTISASKAVGITTKYLAKKGFLASAFTQDLANLAKDKMASVADFMGNLNKRVVARVSMEAQVEEIYAAYDALSQRGRAAVDSFVGDSTRSGAWGYDPQLPNVLHTETEVMRARFAALAAEEQSIVKQVFRHGFDTLLLTKKTVMDTVASDYDVALEQAKQKGDLIEEHKLQDAKIHALKTFQTIFKINPGLPYAPLTQFGDYVTVAKSDKLAAAIADDDTKEIAKLRSEADHYYVHFSPSMGQAQADSARIIALGKFSPEQVKTFEKDDDAKFAAFGGKDVLNAITKLRGLVYRSEDEGSKLADNLLRDLYLRTMAETSVRKSELGRRNVAGTSDEMLRSFVKHGRSTAHFLSSIQYNSKIMENLMQMKKEAAEDTDKTAYYNEFLRRYARSLQYSSTPVQDMVTQATSFWFLATSPSYYLQNATQTFMMTLPMLAGKYGYFRSLRAVWQAYRDLGPLLKTSKPWKQMDLTALPEDVRGPIAILLSRGRVNIGLERELGEIIDGGSTQASVHVKNVTRKMRGVMQQVESINRVAAGIAAYRLSGDVNYADDVIYSTHGDYSSINTPSILQFPGAKIIAQFKKFQLIQASLLVKLAYNAFHGSNPQEKAIARAALSYTLGHAFAMGGAIGMPLATPLAWILMQAFGDPDEPDDPQLALRKLVGNDALGDLLISGAPAAAGMNLSGKLGMGNMLNPFGVADVNFKDKAGATESIIAVLGGPAASLGLRGIEGINSIGRGDYYKGLELLMPKGVADTMRGYRYGTEGVTKKDGTVLMQPDDISFGNSISQAFGLPTTSLTDRTWQTGITYDATQKFKERATELRNRYVKALRNGDDPTDIREAWTKLQEARVRNGFTRQPFQDLLRAPEEAAKRERQTDSGVSYVRQNREFVRSLTQ